VNALAADSEAPPTIRLLAPLLERCAVPSNAARRAVARSLFDYCACVTSASVGATPWAGEPAARLAFAAHARDQDDLHHGSITHPGAIIWSAVCAAGIERQVTWEQAVDAAVLGYELTVRLAEGFGPEHRGQWHATTVAGTVGAAGAAAELLSGGDDGVVLDAVGHATSVASGSAQAQVERTGTRLVHRSFAAGTGLLCARAALAGLPGNRRGLDGERGPFVSAAVAGPVLRDRESTAVEETGFRLYPVNGFAHAAIEAAGTLGPIQADEVERVTVTVSPPAAVAIACNASPATDDDAWWSIEHAVALALADGGPGAVRAGLSDRPEVLRLSARTSVAAGEPGWSATVSVQSRGAGTRRASVGEPLGHVRRPATDHDLCAKWLRLTGSDGSGFLERLYNASSISSLASFMPPSVTSLMHHRPDRPQGSEPAIQPPADRYDRARGS
jgi:2-methylcitrate dehydratase PrpD